jgi:hypothetical protein
MLNQLPPRSFCDFTLPQREDGSDLSSCREPGDYELYVRWLSDYLHTAEIPLSADQSAWVQGRSPDSVVFECSDAFGYAIDAMESLNTEFDSGETHASHRAYMLSLWEDLDAEHREEESFEDWLALSEPTFDRLRSERLQENEAAQPWTHADIPFRPLLAWALRQIPAPEERFRQMDWFFRNFSDNASK